MKGIIVTALLLILGVLSASAEPSAQDGFISETVRYAESLWSLVFDQGSTALESRESAFATGSARNLLIAAFLFLFVFFSEDLSCIGGGILAAAGVVPLGVAVLGCFLGIFVSDILLYWIGRVLGKGALKLKFVKESGEGGAFERLKNGYQNNVFKVVFMTRFIPGSRVVAYITAGILKVKVPRFTASLAIAAGIWTPILVGIAYIVGRPLIDWWEQSGWVVLPLVLLAIIALYVAIMIIARSLTYRGRRSLQGHWIRLTRWEFWPAFPVYFPVAVYGCFLAIKYRSALVWASCNPGMEPLSGLALESKSEILSSLNESSDCVATWCSIGASETVEQRFAKLKDFMKANALEWPIVLKPDVGQRGEGVAVIRDTSAARRYLESNSEAVIAQRFIAGAEFGVFYYRLPTEKNGRVFSITEKRLPELEGDGVRDVERLILDDGRAVAQARHYLKVNSERLGQVPARGESIQLVELGTHCRGAIFLDGNRYTSQALADRLDEVVSTYDGFYFGRFDLRTLSGEALSAGGDFKILELNGVSSESTDIYDPKNSIFAGWAKLCRQWRLAFEIGAANRAAGAPVATWGELLSVLRGHRARQPYEITVLESRL